MFELLRVHQEHELRPRIHPLNRRAPTQRLGPEAPVAGFARHGALMTAAMGRCNLASASVPHAAVPRPPSKIRVGLIEIELFDPAVAISHVVAFGLKFERARNVSDALALVIATIEPGVRAAPDLLDRLVA